MSQKINENDIALTNYLNIPGNSGAQTTPAAGTSKLFGIGTSNLNLGFENESGTQLNITGGLGAWTAWTPTVSAATGTFTTTSSACRYVQVGKTVHIEGSITITTIGTGTGCNFTLPVTAQNINGIVGYAREDATSGKMGVIKFSSTTLAAVIDYNNLSITSGGSGSVVRINGTYEAA